jgi:hypothetical protein
MTKMKMFSIKSHSAGICNLLFSSVGDQAFPVAAAWIWDLMPMNISIVAICLQTTAESSSVSAFVLQQLFNQH